MPTVAFERSVQVDASPDRVWAKLTTPQLVASWVSIVGDVQEIEPLSRYTAVLTDRLGPFRLSADLEIAVTEIEEQTQITFRAEGEDRQVASRIQVEATMDLTETSTGTDIGVNGHYEVTGRVATLGASMIRAKGDKILEEFFSAVSRELG